MRTDGFTAALAAEWLKARRSRVLPITFAAFGGAAGVGALFMFVVAEPDRARDVGLLGQKAQIAGISPDWTGLLSFTAQVVAVGALLLFSFVVTWVFGREFTDGTARYLMAQPVSRAAVVGAKLVLVAAWCLALTAWLTGLSLAVGAAMHLPVASPGLISRGVAGVLLAGVLMVPAVAPIAYVASATGGYLAPLGCALGLMVTAQVAAVLGLGDVFPWSVPAVAVGLVAGQSLGTAGVVSVAVTGTLGVAGTWAWWDGGDAGA